MSEINSFTTIILHDVRKSLGLSCNEYCVVDLIDNSVDDLTRQAIADKMGLSKQAVIKIISSLLKQQLVTKDDANKLQSSERWKNFHEEKNSQVIHKKENHSIFNVPWRPANKFVPFSPKGADH